jgi:RHS repeat-associated protein
MMREPGRPSRRTVGETTPTTASPATPYTFRLSASDNVSNAASTEVEALVPYVTKYYYANGQRVAMQKEGVVYYLHSDHLGSTSILSDENGQQVADSRVAYLPYGGLRLGDASTLPTDYTFTGQRDEAGIGLMHYGARFYSPRLGRFVSADSVVPNPLSPQDFNRYSYVSDNPLRYRDPTGHQNWDAVNEYFMGVVYQIGANNWEAMGVSSVAAVRAGAEEVAQEHSDSMAFEVGRLCGSLGTALQGLGEIEGGLAAAEAGVAVSATGVGALAGVPVAVGGVAVAAHGTVLVGQSVGQADLSAGRLIQMASGRKPPRRPIDGRPQHPSTSPEHQAFGTQRAKEIGKNNSTVRWNQGLVDPEGNAASRLRPDIQYIEDGKVFIEEIQSPNQPLRELIRKEKHYRDALGDYFGGYRIFRKEEYLP